MAGLHSIEDEINLEKNIEATETINILNETDSDGEIDSVLELESTYPAIDEIIDINAEIYIYDSKALNDQVTYKGDALIKMLYKADTDAAKYVTVSKRIPITKTIDFDGVTESGNWSIAAMAYVNDIAAEPLVNNYGENRNIDINMKYAADIIAAKNESAQVTKDVYSTDCCCSCHPTYSNINTSKLNKIYNTNFSVNTSKEKSTVGAEKINGITDSDVNVDIEKVTYDPIRSKLVFEGTAYIILIGTVYPPKTSIIPADGTVPEEPETEYLPIEFSTPLKYEVEASDVSSDFEYFVHTSIIGVKERYDMSNVYADFEVALNVILFNRKTVSIVDTVNLDRDEKTSIPVVAPITLYYPERGEKIWDIAKQYHTTVQALQSANNLGESDTIDTKVLIVPKPKTRSIYSTII
jgi:LysM repeat protein